MDSVGSMPFDASTNTLADSPKRKRGQDTQTTLTDTAVYPQLKSNLATNEEGSPSGKFAGKFRRLVLDNESLDLEDDDAPAVRKRVRPATDEEFPSPSSPTPGLSGVRVDAAEEPTQTAFDSEHVGHLPGPMPSQKRPNSPSLSGEVNAFYWQDSEITGHDPDDSTDDGYGINGIGFKPTPAIAYQRQQRRKQQVEGYRTRESREARQRRSERRRTTIETLNNDINNEQRRAKVRFDDVGIS